MAASDTGRALAAIVDDALDQLDVPMHLTHREIQGILRRAVELAYQRGVNDATAVVEHYGGLG